VPLAPWLGVVLVDITAGAWVVARERSAVAPLNRIAPAWLTRLGRHRLLVYLAHQPILFGILRVVV